MRKGLVASRQPISEIDGISDPVPNPPLMRLSHFILATALLLPIACSESGSGPVLPGGGTTVAPVKATINGQAWSSGTSVTAIRAATGLYSLTALNTSGDYTLAFTLNNIGAAGVYPLGTTASLSGGTVVVSKPGATGWSTPLTGAAGQIVITSLTATRLAGEFAFTATPLTGTGNLTVANGTFDVPVTGAVAFGALPDNLGGRYTGTANGASFAASGVSAILTTGTAPTLTIAATGERTIVISLVNMTGVGAYTLTNASPVRSIQVTGSPTSQTATWYSQGQGGGGTVNITTSTATRFAGNYTATLVPLGGGATGVLTLTGTFDFGRGVLAGIRAPE